MLYPLSARPSVLLVLLPLLSSLHAVKCSHDANSHQLYVVFDSYRFLHTLSSRVSNSNLLECSTYNLSVPTISKFLPQRRNILFVITLQPELTILVARDFME